MSNRWLRRSVGVAISVARRSASSDSSSGRAAWTVLSATGDRSG
ncbi:hypothetical protein OG963_09845 [Streptomyces sp. NBC_01707]